MVTLPEHCKEPKGQADTHCWVEGAQTKGEETLLSKKMGEDGEMVEQGCTHGEIHRP